MLLLWHQTRCAGQASSPGVLNPPVDAVQWLGCCTGPWVQPLLTAAAGVESVHCAPPSSGAEHFCMLCVECCLPTSGLVCLVCTCMCAMCVGAPPAPMGAWKVLCVTAETCRISCCRILGVLD
jgi:hypothetical protein